MLDENLLDQRTLELDGETVPPSTRSGIGQTTLQPGMLVDHFQIVRPLGRGGMGEVYLAHPYCQLLREVWNAVPLVWEDGQAVVRPPPPEHRCSEVERG